MSKALSTTFAVTALVGLFTASLFTPLLPLALKAFEISMPPEHADVIVILGSDINCDDREPDKVGTLRINKGLALFQAGYSSAMTVTDADPVRPPGCPTMGEIQKGYIDGKLKAAGELRKPQVFVLEHAKNTRQEAMRVAALAHRQGWKTILLVSSPSHLRRGVLLFSRAGVRVVPVASDEFRYAAQLPTVKERWVALRLLAHEVLGFIQAFFPIQLFWQPNLSETGGAQQVARFSSHLLRHLSPEEKCCGVVASSEDGGDCGSGLAVKIRGSGVQREGSGK